MPSIVIGLSKLPNKTAYLGYVPGFLWIIAGISTCFILLYIWKLQKTKTQLRDCHFKPKDHSQPSPPQHGDAT